MSEKTKSKIVKVIIIILAVYFFLLSIKLLGHSFKLFGEGFAESLIEMTSNPFTGLLIGIAATSLIQSSSTTTSIVVGMVAGDILTLTGAIPVIMGGQYWNYHNQYPRFDGPRKPAARIPQSLFRQHRA